MWERLSFEREMLDLDLEAEAPLAINVDKAVKTNRYYARKLGWQAHYDRIMKILGFITYTPDERLFAEAVARWQQSQGMVADGIIGPTTWSRMKTRVRGGPASVGLQSSIAAASIDDKLFKYHKAHGGYSRCGGDRVDKLLKELRDSGKLSINDDEVDMLQRIANVETGGRIQGINSYDSAFMSMGFMQLTIKYHDRFNPDGKLQRLIQLAPQAFQKYGIELDAPRKYRIGAYTPTAIKGAENQRDLRSLDWTKRFYSAGLDPDVIVEEVKLALEILIEDKKRRANRVGSSFLPHYDKSPILRALIHETFNNRPAYLYLALKRAIVRAKKMGEISTDQFLELVREAIKEVYKEKEPKDGPKKAKNLIYKTARLVL